MRSGVRSVFAAVTFLTAIPLGRRAATAPRHLESGALLFPLVGALVGALVATTAWGASLAFPPMVAGVIGVACGVLVTGALHLDGLADTEPAVVALHRHDDRQLLEHGPDRHAICPRDR